MGAEAAVGAEALAEAEEEKILSEGGIDFFTHQDNHNFHLEVLECQDCHHHWATSTWTTTCMVGDHNADQERPMVEYDHLGPAEAAAAMVV